MASPNAVTVTRTLAYSTRIASKFQQLRLDDEITDFTICSGKQTFNCHKVILAGSSPVLQAMVRSGMCEASKSQADFDTIPPPVMQLILDYIYIGEVVVPHEHLQQTIEAADYLELLELKEICLSEAMTAFRPSNIVSWYKLADRLDVGELKSKCAETMSFSLVEISQSTEFQELSFAEVNSFVSSTQESDTDPDDILEASIEWINSKLSQRIDCMEEILQKIQLLKCSIECLENELETHEALFMSCPAALKVITKVLLQLAKQDGARKKRRSKTHASMMIIVIGGQSGEELNHQCWELNSSLNLVELCRISGHSVRFGVCQVPNGFVLTGGEECNLCSMFTMSTKSWKQLDHLKFPLYAHGSVFYNGRIFLLGGRISRNKSSSVHSLAVEGGQWSKEADLPFEVSYPEVASVKDNIFLLDIHSNKLLCQNTNAKSWGYRAKLPGPVCSGARMVAVQDQLIAAGGNKKICALYDPSTDVWSTLQMPILKHSYGALVGVNQKVYLIGGSKEASVEEYNLDTKMWSLCDTKVPYELLNLHALALNV